MYRSVRSINGAIFAEREREREGERGVRFINVDPIFRIAGFLSITVL